MNLKIKNFGQSSVENFYQSKHIFPKLELSIFDRNHIEWEGFWDQFYVMY